MALVAAVEEKTPAAEVAVTPDQEVAENRGWGWGGRGSSWGRGGSWGGHGSWGGRGSWGGYGNGWGHGHRYGRSVADVEVVDQETDESVSLSVLKRH